VITIPCLVLIIIGIFFFLLLIPLLGLNPKDWCVLLVLPVVIILWSGVSILVAHLVQVVQTKTRGRTPAARCALF
jgi:hypothetical protein